VGPSFFHRNSIEALNNGAIDGEARTPERRSTGSGCRQSLAQTDPGRGTASGTNPAGAKIIDLGTATLLPGLIDGHTHLFLDIIIPAKAETLRHNNGEYGPGLLLAIVKSPTKRALMGAQAAREDLESGITTVRNLGHSGIDGDTELRDAINAARVLGPRLLASGRKLIAQGSYLQNLNPALSDAILKQEFLLVRGVEQARQAVRENVFQNVRWSAIRDLGRVWVM